MQNRRGASKTIAAAVLIIIVVVAFVAYYFVTEAPSPASTSAPSSAAVLPGKGMAIGVNFDVGGLGDRGFNALAYAGMMQANKTLGVDYYYTIPETTGDFISDLQVLMSHHVNLIVGVGSDQDQAIAQLATEYPKQLFAQIDGDDYNYSNVIVIKYTENVGSAVVAGLAVAMSKTNNIGFVGGMTTGVIYNFWNGWKFGATWADQYLSKVEGHPVNTTLQEAYTGPTLAAFDEPAIDQQIAESMISRGSDVIFTAAGDSGLGGLNAVGTYDEQAGWNWTLSSPPPMWAIGANANQDYYGTYQYFVEHENATGFAGYKAPSFVLTSEIEAVNVGVFDVTKAIVYNNYTNFWNDPQVWAPSFWNGQADLCGNNGSSPCHVRNVYLLGLAQGAVGPTPMTYTSSYLTPLAKRVVAQMTEGILNGSVTVPENYNFTPP